jgi:hypothetical protein
MPAQAVNPDADRLFELLAPELRKLCDNAGPYCDLRLIATIHDFDVGNVTLGIDTKRRIAPRADRGRI